MKQSFERLFENLNRRFLIIVLMQLFCIFGIFAFSYLSISVNQNFLAQFNKLVEVRTLLRNNIIHVGNMRDEAQKGVQPSDKSLAEFVVSFEELNNKFRDAYYGLSHINNVWLWLRMSPFDEIEEAIRADFFRELNYFCNHADNYVLSLVSQKTDARLEAGGFWDERAKAMTVTDAVLHAMQDKSFRINNRSRFILQILFGASLLILGILSFYVFKPLFNQIRLENMNLTNAKREAEEARDVQTRFIANVSHEIRTPLTSILGFADMALLGRKSENDYLQTLRDIKKSANHLESLINDVLDLSRIQIKDLKIEKRPFDINQVFHDIFSTFNMKAKRRNLDFSVRYLTPIPAKIENDPVRLTQVITNLLENSLKYTVGGFIRLEVTYHDHADPRRCLLRVNVRDSGIGINHRRQQDIFKWFYREQSSLMHSNTGFGIGLPLAKEMAEMIGGRLKLIWSEEGKGSLFSLSFRAEPVTDVLVDGFVPFQHKPDAELDLGRFKGMAAGKSVLLVEDGVENQNIVKFFMEYAGAEVDVADNGAIGLEALNKRDYELVIMDLQMPVMDGYAAMRRLNESSYGKPVVALTAHAMRDEKEKCLSIGFTDYLTKPIDIELLLETVFRHLKISPTDPREGGDAGESGSGAAATSTSEEMVQGSYGYPGVVSGEAQDGGGQLAEEGRMLSRYHGVELYMPLIATFAENLKTRQVEVKTEYLKQYGDLNKVLHKIKGTSSMYGFSELSDQAGALEELIKADADKGRIDSKYQHLMSVMKSIVSSYT